MIRNGADKAGRLVPSLSQAVAWVRVSYCDQAVHEKQEDLVLQLSEP